MLPNRKMGMWGLTWIMLLYCNIQYIFEHCVEIETCEVSGGWHKVMAAWTEKKQLWNQASYKTVYRYSQISIIPCQFLPSIAYMMKEGVSRQPPFRVRWFYSHLISRQSHLWTISCPEHSLSSPFSQISSSEEKPAIK